MKTKKISRKKSESVKKKEDILQQYQLLMDFMDNIPDVIYFKDLKGRLILVNQAHAKGLGLSPKDVIGKTDFDIFSKQRAAKMKKDDQYVMKTGKPLIDKTERATRADGIDNYVSTTKIPRFNDKGKVIGLIGITRDVTKRMHFEHLNEEKTNVEKKMQMLEDMNKVKSEFVSSVSHELRTPLAIIKQLLSLIFDETAGPINDKQREILVKTRKNIERLRRIIDELLDISRIEGKRLRLHYSLVNLNDLLRDSEDYFKKVAKEKNIKLSYHFPKNEISIFIDVERVVQVVMNLIGNAIKFTGENGKIDVEVKILETKVRIGVIDTGIGIAKADEQKIFEKFVQLSRTQASGEKGIGLGLTLVKEFVERHGGEIWIESKVGVGSKFYFTLPRFYTAHMLGKATRDKIKSLLEKNKQVYLINLLIVNFKEFQKRIKINSRRLSRDLKEILSATYKDFSRREKERHDLFITGMQGGKYHIIFSDRSEKDVSAFCEALKEKMKEYFNKNKIEDAFIALGILSYKAAPSSMKGQGPANLNIKEIYVGSEMRRFKRVIYKTDVQIIKANKQKETVQSIDMSGGGVCILSSKDYKTDEELTVKIKLLRKKKTVTAKMRVSWIKQSEHLSPEEGQNKIGLGFTKLSGNDKNILSDELKLYYE